MIGKPNTFYGNILKWVGWIMLVLGFLVGYITGNVTDPVTYKPVQNWGITISIWLGVFITSLLFWSASQIIQILYNIYLSQEQRHESSV